MTITVLSYFPGQVATFFQEVKNSFGERIDGYVPVVSSIIVPGLTLAANYPQDMTRIDTGLYYFSFTLPTGAVSIGSYLANISYTNPDTLLTNYNLVQILVSAPFGNLGITTF